MCPFQIIAPGMFHGARYINSHIHAYHTKKNDFGLSSYWSVFDELVKMHIISKQKDPNT